MLRFSTVKVKSTLAGIALRMVPALLLDQAGSSYFIDPIRQPVGILRARSKLRLDALFRCCPRGELPRNWGSMAHGSGLWCWLDVCVRDFPREPSVRVFVQVDVVAAL